MGFPRQEHWSGLPFPSPGDLPDPGIEAASAALAGGFFTTEPPGKPLKAGPCHFITSGCVFLSTTVGFLWPSLQQAHRSG